MSEDTWGFSVATPERVTFRYSAAGIGSRFAAQLLDWLILVGAFIALTIFAIAVGLTQDTVGTLVYVLGSFLLFFGYFPLMEGIWSGQTVGKRVLKLRVVGDGGQPLTVTQVAIRNVVRLVDFLPLFYGIGVVSAFISKQNKRLGDLAAGTIVVRDREWVNLRQLTRQVEPPDAAPAPATAAAGGPPAHYDAEFRRFLGAYISRRRELSAATREQLAVMVLPQLRQAAPELLQREGALRTLDLLADQQSG